MHASPFELLELPDGRWCVARFASAAGALIAGSFAPLDARSRNTPSGGGAPQDPVGIFPSRDEAELAIQRETPVSPSPLAPFAAWLRP
jgi:hypothetical protein